MGGSVEKDSVENGDRYKITYRQNSSIAAAVQAEH